MVMKSSSMTSGLPASSATTKTGDPVFTDVDVYSFVLKCSTLALYYKGIEFAYFPTDAAFTGKVKYVSG